MEDYLVKEIDKIGQMLLQIAKRLGLFKESAQGLSWPAVKEEFLKCGMDLDLDAVLQKENPVLYLVGECHFSSEALETFSSMVAESDLEQRLKDTFLDEAVTYLDSTGHYSFTLHSYTDS